jgi:hypothetical protein
MEEVRCCTLDEAQQLGKGEVMAGPWEKYAQPSTQDGPWVKYGGADSGLASQGKQTVTQAQSPSAMSDTLKAGAEGLFSGAAEFGNTLLTPVRAGLNMVAPKRQTLKGLVTGEAPKRQGDRGW